MHLHQKYQRIRNCFMPLSLVIGLLVWIVLLLSPIGPVVAAFTIFCLIVILFILGCIRVKEDDFRK